MRRRSQICLTMWLIAWSWLVVTPEYAAQELTVEFTIEPNVRVFSLIESDPPRVEPKDIEMTTRTTAGQNVTFQWKLQGPGTLEGDVTDPVIYYVPPTSIPKETAEVIISLTVKDSEGRKALKQETFMLKKQTVPNPTPLPFDIRQVSLVDEEGANMNPTYHFAPGETATLQIEVTDAQAESTCTSARGKIAKVAPQQFTYTAPVKSGGRDIITIKTVDPHTGAVIQKIIKIQIKESAEKTP